MADRDATPVTIHLDQQRPYRVRDEDREAVWVGPGTVQVPKWVAEHWGNTIVDASGQTERKGTSLTPTLPADVVSATVETVKEAPLKTTETVQVFQSTKPATRKRRR